MTTTNNRRRVDRDLIAPAISQARCIEDFYNISGTNESFLLTRVAFENFRLRTSCVRFRQVVRGMKPCIIIDEVLVKNSHFMRVFRWNRSFERVSNDLTEDELFGGSSVEALRISYNVADSKSPSATVTSPVSAVVKPVRNITLMANRHPPEEKPDPLETEEETVGCTKFSDQERLEIALFESSLDVVAWPERYADVNAPVAQSEIGVMSVAEKVTPPEEEIQQEADETGVPDVVNVDDENKEPPLPPTEGPEVEDKEDTKNLQGDDNNIIPDLPLKIPPPENVPTHTNWYPGFGVSYLYGAHNNYAIDRFANYKSRIDYSMSSWGNRIKTDSYKGATVSKYKRNWFSALMQALNLNKRLAFWLIVIMSAIFAATIFVVDDSTKVLIREHRYFPDEIRLFDASRVGVNGWEVARVTTRAEENGHRAVYYAQISLLVAMLLLAPSLFKKTLFGSGLNISVVMYNLVRDVADVNNDDIGNGPLTVDTPEGKKQNQFSPRLSLVTRLSDTYDFTVGLLHKNIVREQLVSRTLLVHLLNRRPNIRDWSERRAALESLSHNLMEKISRPDAYDVSPLVDCGFISNTVLMANCICQDEMTYLVGGDFV